MLRQPHLKLTAAFCVLALAATANANAAMGLALEVFDYRIWFVYVAATVVFEAWLMGRKLNVPIGTALGVSFLANLLTALMGVFAFTTCFAPVLHSMAPNPNPFLRVLVALVILGLVSAYVESKVWKSTAKKLGAPDKAKEALHASLITHALGVPLALAILLAPPYPYTGIDATTKLWRRAALYPHLTHALRAERTRMQAGGKPRAYHSLSEFLKLDPEYHPSPGSADWAEMFEVHYGRFDFGESGRLPLKTEFNPKLDWNYYDESTDSGDWVLRIHSDGRVLILSISDLEMVHFEPEKPN